MGYLPLQACELEGYREIIHAVSPKVRWPSLAAVGRELLRMEAESCRQTNMILQNVDSIFRQLRTSGQCPTRRRLSVSSCRSSTATALVAPDACTPSTSSAPRSRRIIMASTSPSC